MTAHQLFALLAIAVALDVALTLYAISLGAREINPLLRHLFGVVGPLPAMLFTHAGVLAIVWLDLAHTPRCVLAAATVAWWALVAWNLWQIRRQRRARS
jgi:predicted membrane protein